MLGEDHRHSGLLAGLDHLGVAFGAAGLDHGSGAGLNGKLAADRQATLPRLAPAVLVFRCS
jgi:hypothetical protein